MDWRDNTGTDMRDNTNHALKTILQAASAIIGKVSIDQTTPGTTNRVDIGVFTAGETHLGEVGGRIVRVQVTKARPNDTTAYAANDTICESASAGTVWTLTSMARVSGGSGTILDAIAITSNAANVARLEFDLYTVAPTAINDNAEATQLVANVSNYVGTLAFPALAKKTTNSTIATAISSTTRLSFKTSGSANLFAISRTLDAFTPVASASYWLVCRVLQD